MIPPIPGRPALEDLADSFAAHTARLPLAEATVRSYNRGVAGFAEWLAGQEKHVYGDVATDELAATYAVRDYRRHLLTERKLAPKSVDAVLTAISALYGWWGMARPNVRLAASKTTVEPKALSEEEARDVLRAAERRGVRDHAVLMVMYAAGPRVEETHNLDVDDVAISERKGVIKIRAGKGGKYREVALNGQACAVLRRWLRLRVDQYGQPAESGPLFVTPAGTRMAIRTIRHLVDRVGEAAGVDLNPHMLRHTFGTRLARKGVDPFTIADLMGHESLETTRAYTRSTGQDRDRAVELLTIDY